MRSSTCEVTKSALFAAAIILLPLSPTGAVSVPSVTPTVDADGTVHIPNATIPFSSLASPEAKQAFIAEHKLQRDERFAPSEKANSPEDEKKQIAKFRSEYLKAFAFPLKSISKFIGGIEVEEVTPSDGVPKKNQNKILINLHGGGFFSGWGTNSVAETYPMAYLARIKVITVNYREAPQARYPAATEDVAAVYRALLRRYRPENIGVYGCSAGGTLTAQAVAWFQSHGLPRPGAIGMFCSGAIAAVWGDSFYIGTLLDGSAVPNPVPVRGAAYLDNYYRSTNVKDSAASPAFSLSVLKKFPPSLIISGTRDAVLSDAVFTHSQLIKAGAKSDLHVWEGMGHTFLYGYGLPESQDAWQVIVTFFKRNLGRQTR